ncbi:formylglycine-generating enzyme family protein [Uruburuella testudinis]|uniref:Formylglycine-generating enzyme family protein n=1 Tax=Uruburuella testudinis TaxID=1282863 RepID=A0ABY4DPB8_9NEIS|nr:formylglycine-generating enzyme family protein [Uruburuella testudinis]UOO80899.1 formylglycine-generating enzyme family protein [Uruburuella testudinis]
MKLPLLFSGGLLALLSACSQAENITPAAPMPSETPPQTAAAPASVYTNSIGMKFVAVPAGSFLMGSAAADSAAFDVEKPQHRVTLSQPFYIGQYEVTQADWERVMGEGPFARSRSNPYYSLPGMAARITRPNHPATVSWQDAQEFIAKLNALEQTTRYRLPTEAEWEYAARAGTQSAYSFGNNEADLGRYAWFGENFTGGGSHPVGQKLPNAWGLYDMHGNAWEWVNDWFTPYTAAAQTDPQGAASGSDKTVRGGSWHRTATSWRVAFRKPYPIDYRGISVGFRLAMDAP